MKISLRGVSKSFGSTHALRSVTLEFSEGVNLLLGPNGSGKTTLINVLAGITYPDSGTITIDGLEFRAERRGEWRKGVRLLTSRMGLLSDKPGYPPNYSGLDLLRFSIPPEADPDDAKEWLHEIIGTLEMEGYISRRIAGYSSGMVQRLGVAASLVARPSLILWDEPIANLDAKSRLAVVELAKKVVSAGSTLIVASHILAEFEPVTNWLGIMRLGEMVVSGTIDELGGTTGTYLAETDSPVELARVLLEHGVVKSLTLGPDSVRFVMEENRDFALESLIGGSGIRVRSLRRELMKPSEIYRKYEAV